MRINFMVFVLIMSVISGNSRATEPGTDTPDLKALAARANAAKESCGNTPGREFGNLLRGEWYKRWMAFFSGKGVQPKDGTSEEDAVAKFTEAIRLAEEGVQWPMPQLTSVPLANGPISIDGRLDEPDWARAATFNGVYRFNDKIRLSEPKTTWRILWDNTNLYFSFDCEDSDLIAPEYKRDDPVFNDDCVEVFILPDFRFRTFWEIVVSPSGSIFDSVECKRAQHWGSDLDPSQNMDGLKTGITVRGTLNKPGDTDQGYTVEIAVPFKELPGYTRTGPKAGDHLHFMLVRLDRNGKEFKAYSFQPLLGWGHNIWNHAEMELGK